MLPSDYGGEALKASPIDFFRFVFLSSLGVIAVCMAAFILSASTNSPGEANVLDSSLVGTGTMDYRHDTQHSSDRAMAENATILYEYSKSWGVDMPTETATSNFIISSGKGGYKTQYIVRGSGANHKVDYRATKILGDASFASEITLTATEASGESFDSVVEFDTRSGNATIKGRVYNSTAGRPATMEELDAVGKYLLNTHLNVSNAPILPDDWLGFCSSLDQDVNMPEGIYILPVNDSKYNYTLVAGKIVRLLNASR